MESYEGHCFEPGANERDRAPCVSARVPLPPAHFSFSTQGIPSEGKFETWRDVWMRRLVGVEVSSDSPETFQGRIDLWNAGPLDIVLSNVKSSCYERTASLADNGDDDFSLTLWREGMTVNSMKSKVAQIKPGGAFFLSHDRPFTVDASDNSCFLLRINRKALLALMPRDFDVGMRTFAPGSRVLQLIKDTLPLITNRTEPTTQERRQEIGQQIIDLVALLFRPSRDARAQIDVRGLRAARLGAVLKAIDRRFADPRLTAASVGRDLGLSGRHVNRLLEKTTKTFNEHLLERRLAHAHELLCDADTSDTKVADVAFQAGFTDATYFGQCFRRRYGDTPTGLRAAAATERALRHVRHSLALA